MEANRLRNFADTRYKKALGENNRRMADQLLGGRRNPTEEPKAEQAVISAAEIQKQNERELTPEQWTNSLEKRFNDANTPKALNSKKKSSVNWNTLETECKSLNSSLVGEVREKMERGQVITPLSQASARGAKMKGSKWVMPSIKEQLPDLDEDRMLIAMITIDGKKYPLQAVFDGHGGAEVSEHLKNEFPAFLEKQLASEKWTDKRSDVFLLNVLKTIFVKFNKQFDEKIDCGSTACFVLEYNGFLYTASVGDSRAIISVDDEKTPAIALSIDDTVVNNKKSVEKRGGEIDGQRLVATIDGKEISLAVPRAVGDLNVPGVNPRTRVTRYSLAEVKSKKNPFLLIASDGLWDVATSNEASKTFQAEISKVENMPTVLEKMLAKVWNSNESDNTTIIARALFDQGSEDKKTEEASSSLYYLTLWPELIHSP